MFIEIFTTSGPFGGLATLVGVLGTATAVRQLIRRESGHLTQPALCLAAASWFIGLLGTGIGQRVCFDAVHAAEPETMDMLWRAGTSVAELSTSVGAFWAAIILLLVALASALRR